MTMWRTIEYLRCPPTAAELVAGYDADDDLYMATSDRAWFEWEQYQRAWMAAVDSDQSEATTP